MDKALSEADHFKDDISRQRDKIEAACDEAKKAQQARVDVEDLPLRGVYGIRVYVRFYAN